MFFPYVMYSQITDNIHIFLMFIIPDNAICKNLKGAVKHTLQHV